MNYDDRVLRRLEGRTYLADYRRKVHKLRKIIAGDLSDLPGVGMPSQHAPSQPDVEPVETIREADDLYDIFPTEFETGRSNAMIKALRTLAMQASYSMPEIEFVDFTAEQQEFHQRYLRARLSGAYGVNAVNEMRMALLDYLGSGLGWAGITNEGGKLCVRHFDTLDMNWDRGSKLLHKIRWQSTLVNDTAEAWIAMFGQGVKDQLGIDPNDHEALERTYELEWYWDIEGEGHTYVVGPSGKYGGEREIIYQGPSEWYRDMNGLREPFLPIEPMYFMQMPSSRYPLGLAEMMLPSQIGIWMIERLLRERVQRFRPFYAVEGPPLDTETQKQLASGNVGAVLDLKDGQRIVPVEGGTMDPNVLALLQQYEQEVVGQGGASPFANNSRPQGVEFAAEVHQMAEMGNLVGSVIARDNAQWWSKVLAKYLSAARLYDDEPVKFRWLGTEITFGPTNPISDFIRDDVEPIVREDTLAYMSSEARRQKALADLQVGMSVKQVAPATVGILYEEYLQAAGVRDIQAHMAAPVMEGGSGEQLS